MGFRLYGLIYIREGVASKQTLRAVDNRTTNGFNK